MTEFEWPTPLTADTVAQAGWTPDRHVAIEPWIDELTAQGYHFSPTARTILASFGGLAVHPPAHPEATWGSDPVFFDPLEAGDGMYDRYRPLEDELRQRMAPLASWGGESTVLILDDDRVVADSSWGLQLLGKTFPDALDLAIRRHRRPEFLIDYRSRG